MTSRVVLAFVQRALMRRKRSRPSLVFVPLGVLCCTTFVTLTAFMTFATAVSRSNSYLRKMERPFSLNAAATLEKEVTEAQRTKLDFAKYTGGSADLRSLLKADAAYVPFSGTAYSGTAISLPGRIEAENFDNGGEGVAYHDTTSTNEGDFTAPKVSISVLAVPRTACLSVGLNRKSGWSTRSQSRRMEPINFRR
jgi:hypothetical protein